MRPSLGVRLNPYVLLCVVKVSLSACLRVTLFFFFNGTLLTKQGGNCTRNRNFTIIDYQWNIWVFGMYGKLLLFAWEKVVEGKLTACGPANSSSDNWSTVIRSTLVSYRLWYFLESFFKHEIGHVTPATSALIWHTLGVKSWRWPLVGF